MKPLKDKLRDRDLVKGMHTTLNDSSVTEMCGMVRFDFIWIDTEHTTIDYHTLTTHVITARAVRTHALARIPCNDATYAKRMLELESTFSYSPLPTW